MKKQKLSLEELKVESFVTNQKMMQGGVTPTITLKSLLELAPTVIEFSIAVGESIAKMSDACPEFSEAVDCTFSA